MGWARPALLQPASKLPNGACEEPGREHSSRCTGRRVVFDLRRESVGEGRMGNSDPGFPPDRASESEEVMAKRTNANSFERAGRPKRRALVISAPTKVTKEPYAAMA